ncbi:SDR family NAD(P)-dependent oxidoreductase [Candidatus Cardinium hertigii]|uniref:Polyketide synthase PksM n=1 Tax=Candidatus Cardinium hertigii TaxID=247481 RepID=A0A2Z3L7Z5_9BACT|nr:SDR family NAD(P)-dependent oxidoreductase [Candidatus Cardinium hertigii]AWN81559.1 Polyketide synthase PksM [Candidatus Cardinium hertigii]
MENRALHIFRSIWKKVGDSKELKDHDTIKVFLYFDNDVLEMIKSLNSSNIITYPITINDLTLDPENRFTSLQKELEKLNAKPLNVCIALTGSMNNLLTDYPILESFLKNTFFLFQTLLAIKEKINVLLLKESDCVLAGIMEGIGFSLVEEHSSFLFKSLEVKKLNEDGFRSKWLNGALFKAPFNLIKDNEIYEGSFESSQLTNINNTLLGKKVYLITGQGKIALRLAKFLSSKYQAKIIIFGRSALTEIEKNELPLQGVATYIKVDIGNLGELQEAWDYCLAKYEIIHGIFHLAGVLNDKLFQHKKYKEFAETLYPKIQCTINLDKISAQTKLDFFVCFSSLSGTMGNLGQADYAAANSFLKYWSMHRNQKYLQGERYGNSFCIDWGLWENGGMHIPYKQEKLLPLHTQEALHAMEYIFSSSIHYAIIYKGTPSLLIDFIKKFNNSAVVIPDFQFEQAENSFTKNLTHWVKEIIVAYTKLHDLEENDSIIEKGADSVAAINIASEIERKLRKINDQVRINKTILFDKPTIVLLTEYIKGHFLSEIKTIFSGFEKCIDTYSLSNEIAYSNSPVEEIKNHFPSARDDAIAIIGFAGQFPEADSIEVLWSNLIQGKNCIKIIPKDRWNWRKYYDPDPKNEGTAYGRHGGFLRSIKLFDPSFFNISPAEAERMDPQERLLLQNTYHAIQDSALTPESLYDSGVFISVMYGHYISYDEKKESIDSSYASLANRISYNFNFKGPSIAVDSMCSGGLTALHLAIQSVKNGDCASAIIGGVNLMPHPVKYKILSQGRFLSLSGKCNSFGKDADGYVPGEGAVVLIIKQLKDALKNKDYVYGIIRGSAINSGGKSAGYTVPNPTAQTEVIKKALERSLLPPEAITYLETHGTGTPLGDPIEIQGLTEAYKVPYKQHYALGALKANIGHLESAAGIAAIIKVLLQFRYKKMVPTINCSEENPLLNLKKTPFFLVKKLQDWMPVHNYPRVAGISSFGAGGSNAHVIIQEPPSSTVQNSPILPIYILPLSAKTAYSLKENVLNFKKWLKNVEHISLYSLSYSAACCREHFRYRCSVLFSSQEELVDKLEELVAESLWKHFKTSLLTINSTIENLLSSLHKDVESNEYVSLIREVNKLYKEGYNIPWEKIYKLRSVVKLPLYTFDLKEYWSNEFERSINNTLQQDTSITFQHYNSQEDLNYKETKKEIFYYISQWVKSSLDVKNITDTQNIILIDKLIYWEGYKNTYSYIVAPFDYKSFKDALNAIVFTNSSAKPIKIFINLQGHILENNNHYIEYFFEISQLIIKSVVFFEIVIVKEELGNIDDACYAALMGLFKSIILESNHIKVKLLTLSKSISGQQLLNIFINESTYYSKFFEEITYRHETRLVRTFHLQQFPNINKSLVLRDKGVYIISGGLGKIGQVIAEYLAHFFKATLILFGSSELTQDKKNVLKKLQTLGGKIVYKQVDITDVIQLQELINIVTLAYGNINGVIHAAGRTKDKLFFSKEIKDFKNIVDIKIKGAVALDEATKTQSLDFFLLFSSVASVFGNIGQTDYATGNSFMDTFATVRNVWVENKERSGRTASINWPLWDSGGMQVSKEKVNLIYEQQGIAPITNRAGLHILLSIINNINYISQGAIMPLQGDKIKINEALHGLFDIPIAKLELNSSCKMDASVVPEKILTHISELIKLDKHSIEMETTFGDIGFDSVLLQKLADKLKESFEVTVPPNIFFTFNTPGKIQQYIQDKLPKQTLNSNELIKDNSLSLSINDLTHKQSSYGYKVANCSIIGINGIMPNALSLEDFWRNMQSGINAIQPIKRWKNRNYYGGVIPQMKYFDPAFFNLSAREAMLMDPQHRLFLQVAYSTILDAGYNPQKLNKVGVFVGVQFNDYQILLQQWKQSRHPYAATGNAHAMLANRVSYLLNFNGPSQTVDSACSSALVALRRAVLALENYECDYALVGAVSLLIDHEVSDAAASMGVLSSQGRCATFDEEADGYVRGEGVGCVLLKRNSDAVRDKDNIYGNIISCSENHGGKAHSLTAPNPEAQKALLIHAYKDKALARRVSYIETHGTGTKLGDPIEIDALKMAWRALGIWEDKPYIGLGSVKTHIGHLEPAAGIASLLKVLLSIKHKALPGNLHFNKLNPYIAIHNSPFYIVSNNQSWESDTLRVAGISSFGFGGSNAHVVIEEALPREIDTNFTDKPFYLVCLSAKALYSLQQSQKNLAHYLANLSNKAYSLANIAYTLNSGRSHFPYRCAWIIKNIAELIDGLHQQTEAIVAVSSKEKMVETLGDYRNRDTYYCELQERRKQYLAGYDLDWELLHDHEPKLRLSLPTYPFYTKPYWFETAADSSMIKEII